MKEMNSRQRQAAETKRHLVETATSLFNARGYQRTTIQDICSAAGMSVGVFYHYFSSKNDMLKEVQGRKTAELLEMIDRQSVSRTHLEAIRELLRFLVIQQSAGELELVRHALTPTPGGRSVMDRDLWNLAVSVVRSAQGAGELRRDWSPEEIASDLLLSARGFVLHWCEMDGNFDLLPAFDGYLTRIMEGCLPQMDEKQFDRSVAL